MRVKLLAAAVGVGLLSAAVAAQTSKQIQIFASILDGRAPPPRRSNPATCV